MTEPDTFKVMELPVPVSKNVWQRGHWTFRRRIKKRWEAYVWAWVNTPPRMKRPVDHVTVHLYVKWDKPGPLPDSINLDMAHECIADGLVKAGIIPDDQTQYSRGHFRIVRVPKGQGQTLATVTVVDTINQD